MAGLVGAITWNLITWFVGLPSSSSHALIGGMIGSAIAADGADVVNWERGQGQGADPVAHRAVPRRRVRLRAHPRDHVALARRPPTKVNRGLPARPARLGRLRGVHARDERRAEDDGDHRPGARRVRAPRPELRPPADVGDRRRPRSRWPREPTRAAGGSSRRSVSASRRSTRRRDSRRRRRARRSSGGRRTSGSRSRRRTRSPAPCSAPARSAGFSAVRWGVAGNILVAWILTLPAAALVGAFMELVTRLPGRPRDRLPPRHR